MTKDPVKVVIGNSCALFRAGVHAILVEEPSVTVLAEAENGTQLLAKTRYFHPDVVLIDVSFPDLNAVEVIHRLKALNHKIPVLLLTVSEDEGLIRRCLDAGASGYLPRNCPASEMISAVNAVRRGHLPARVWTALQPQLSRAV